MPSSLELDAPPLVSPEVDAGAAVVSPEVVAGSVVVVGNPPVLAAESSVCGDAHANATQSHTAMRRVVGSTCPVCGCMLRGSLVINPAAR